MFPNGSSEHNYGRTYHPNFHYDHSGSENSTGNQARNPIGKRGSTKALCKKPDENTKGFCRKSHGASGNPTGESAEYPENN